MPSKEVVKTPATDTVLGSLPDFVKYPLIGSIPILILAILGAVAYGIFVLMPWWALLTLIGVIVGYGVLYWLGYSMEHS